MADTTLISEIGIPNMLLGTGERTAIYPVIVFDVESIKCRALLDTGAGSSML